MAEAPTKPKKDPAAKKRQTPETLGFRATMVIGPSGKRRMVKRPL